MPNKCDYGTCAKEIRVISSVSDNKTLSTRHYCSEAHLVIDTLERGASHAGEKVKQAYDTTISVVKNLMATVEDEWKKQEKKSA